MCYWQQLINGSDMDRDLIQETSKGISTKQDSVHHKISV